MKDKALQRRIADLQELIELWSQFYGVIEAVKKGTDLTDENDRGFLDVKSNIARKFQAMADKFEQRTFPEDDITHVLSQAVSLEQISKMSSYTMSQLENIWHRVYIAMNRILGHLEHERDALARVSWLGLGTRRLFQSKLLILLIILTPIFACVFMGYRLYTQRILPLLEVSEEGEETEAQVELANLLREARELISDLRGQPSGELEEGETESKLTEVITLFSEYGTNWYAIGTALFGAIVCGWMASNKGRSTILWGAFGLLCCPIAFIVLLLKS